MLSGARAGRVLRGITEAQSRNLERFRSKLPSGAGTVKVEMTANGGVKFSADVPARNIPGSFARYVKDVDRNGKTINYVKITYDANGRVLHVKPKF